MTDHSTTHESQLPRLRKIEGQVRGLMRMIEEGRYCVDILTQMRSVTAALHRVQENIFRHHLESCVHDSLAGGDEKDKEARIDEIIDLVSRFRSP